MAFVFFAIGTRGTAKVGPALTGALRWRTSLSIYIYGYLLSNDRPS